MEGFARYAKVRHCRTCQGQEPCPCRTLCPCSPGSMEEHKGLASGWINSTTQRVVNSQETASYQQSSTSPSSLPASCTWISTWRARMIADCKEQRLILLQTSLAICLAVQRLWILGEDYLDDKLLNLFHVSLINIWVLIKVYENSAFSINLFSYS